MKHLTPQEIVRELDRYIVGQPEAKRAVAIALRNRYRRLALPDTMQAEITPKNILMIGPTGVGKTEIARRLAKLADAPFVKVEATKFTQIGYVGRDVESIVRDLMEAAVSMVHEERVSGVREVAEQKAEDRLIDILTDKAIAEEQLAARAAARRARATSAGATSGGPAALGVAASPVPATVMASLPATKRKQLLRKRVADQLARHELDDKIVEIEVESEDHYSSVFEFVAGLSSDEGDGFPDLLTSLPRSKRSRSVSVKEARRLLTNEEANKLVDLESVVDLATQRVEQMGIVFLDEIDKIVGSKVDTGPDVSGEGVQRDLLPVIEGSTVPTRYGTIKTDHILWIAAGAFTNSKPSDLIPELQGRLPLRVELASLGQEDYQRILTQPENSLTRQYTALLGVEEVTLAFTNDGIAEIARCAARMNERVENIGARRLHTIMERLLEDISFAASEHAGETVTVDAAFVRERLTDLLADEDLSRYIL
jgi:ATP-dependent HslUV protease ATP-binding subunit HslU